MVKHTRETWLVILTWLNITHDHVARKERWTVVTFEITYF